MPATVRVWRRVEVGGPDECWLWTGAKGSSGYGHLNRIGREGGQVGAHVAALESHLGHEVPEGMEVMHSCDNRLCCNPAHLSFGTHLENEQDKKSKDRHHWGIHSGPSRHSDETIELIRTLRSEGLSQRAVALRIGCSQSHVSRVVLRKQRARSSKGGVK